MYILGHRNRQCLVICEINNDNQPNKFVKITKFVTIYYMYNQLSLLTGFQFYGTVITSTYVIIVFF